MDGLISLIQWAQTPAAHAVLAVLLGVGAAILSIARARDTAWRNDDTAQRDAGK